jgi:hypothetical protein
MGLYVIFKATNKTFREEVVGHAVCSERKVLKSDYIFFHCTKVSHLGHATQIMGVGFKSFIEVVKKLGPRNIPLG